MSSVLKSTVAAGALVAGLTLTSGAYAAEEWDSWWCDSDEGAIPVLVDKLITYKGDGCPKGSVDAFFYDENFTIFFDPEYYTAKLGPDGEKRASLKSCALRFRAKLPAGFQISIADVLWKGYAQLANKNVYGKLSTQWTWPFTPPQTAFTQIQGKYDDFYDLHEEVLLPSYSRCATSVILGVNSTVSLTGDAKPFSQMELQTLDATTQLIMKCNVRKCRSNKK